MLELVSTFRRLLDELSPVMTAPTFGSMVIVVTGWLFAARRTITGMIQAAGAVGKKHHSAFHRLFASARWSLDDLGLAVMGMVLRALPHDEDVFLAIDDTLARKRGLKVFGVGMHLDPLLSSRGKKIVNWGHSWVVLGVLARVPLWKDRWFCLPVLARLYRSKQTLKEQPREYRTRPELAVEMLEVICRAHADRHFNAVADSSYSGKSVVKRLPNNCELTGRMHMKARLYGVARPRSGRINGRPRKRGERLANPEEMLDGKTRAVELDMYGRHEKAEIAEAEALWYKTAGARVLKVVAVRPASGGRKKQAFYSTRFAASAQDVLGWYARRWSIEVTFHEVKGHLGFEEPQGWTRRAVERTAPMALMLYGLVVLWYAQEGHKKAVLVDSPWYRGKQRASFLDMLAALRRQSLRETFLTTPQWDRKSIKAIKALVEVCCKAA